MGPIQFALVGLLIIGNLLQIGEAIKCYDCLNNDVTANANCVDPFDSTKNTLKECGEGYTGCLKIQEGDQVLRTCVNQTESEICAETGHFCKVCTEDGCNSSKSILPSIMLVISATLLKYFT